MDLVDLQKFSEFNKGFKYLLTAVDCFSRYGFAVPLKTKRPVEVIEGLALIFKEYGIPLKVFTDKGTEFLAKPVADLFKELGIQQWYSYNPGKAVMVERFNRTLKERLWTHMTDRNNYEYIQILPDVVESYNNSVHSATGYAPAKVDSSIAKKILENMGSEPIGNSPKYILDDKVRIQKDKKTFEKGYESKYSEQIFKIVKVRQSDQHWLYQISDLADKKEPGWFYETELSKVIIDQHEKHRISKILKERKVKGKVQYLVRWVGYPSAFDSWEFKDKVK